MQTFCRDYLAHRSTLFCRSRHSPIIMRSSTYIVCRRSVFLTRQFSPRSAGGRVWVDGDGGGSGLKLLIIFSVKTFDGFFSTPPLTTTAVTYNIYLYASRAIPTRRAAGNGCRLETWQENIYKYTYIYVYTTAIAGSLYSYVRI